MQLISGCVHTTKEVPVRRPQTRLMRDALGSVGGKHVRVSSFVEGEDKPVQSFARARDPSPPENMVFLKSEPRGWGVVYVMLLLVFGTAGKKDIISFQQEVLWMIDATLGSDHGPCGCPDPASNRACAFSVASSTSCRTCKYPQCRVIRVFETKQVYVLVSV
jgi:hypothetical protein